MKDSAGLEKTSSRNSAAIPPLPRRRYMIVRQHAVTCVCVPDDVTLCMMMWHYVRRRYMIVRLHAVTCVCVLQL